MEQEGKKKEESFLRKAGDFLFFVFLLFILSYPFCGTIDRYSGYRCPWFGLRNAVVRTGSMSTANKDNTYLDETMKRIYPKDLVTLKEYSSYEEIKLYDVLAYVNPDGFLICHRVVALYTEKGKDWIVTRGDSNNVDDDSFTFEQTRGKVINVLPGVGPVIDFFSSPYLLMAVFGSGFFIFLGMYIYDLKIDPEGKDGMKEGKNGERLAWLPEPPTPKDPSI